MNFDLTAASLLFTIAAIGISETAYLIRKRIAAERPICPIGEGCVTVLNSKYNKLFFGVHNDIGGLLFYMSFLFFSSFLVIGVGDLNFWKMVMQFMLIGATAMSAALTFIQWKVIKAWCFWCVMSAITVALMDIIILLV
jgi:uncharacterized membrane protein